MDSKRRLPTWTGHGQRHALTAFLTLGALVPAQHASADALRPPFNMRLEGHLPVSAFSPAPTSVEDAWVQDGYAYVTGKGPQGGVFVVDIADPRNPRVVAHHPVGTEDVQVANDLMFAGGIEVVDVRDPRSPERLSRLVPSAPFGTCHTLFFDPESAFAFCPRYPENDTQVFSLAGFNPDNPPATIQPTLTLSQVDHAVNAVGGIMYGASGKVRSIGGGFPDRGTAVSGGHSLWPTPDHKFLVSTSEGPIGSVTLADLQWSSGPGSTLVGSAIRATYAVHGNAPFWPPPPGFPSEYGSAHDVTVDSRYYAHVSFYEAGVKVLKVGRTGTLRLAASFDTSTVDAGGECCSVLAGAWGVHPIAGTNLVLVVDQEEGLFILRQFTLEEIAILVTQG